MADVGPPYLEIKDWTEFQHYRDRRPPWIKLYASLLTDMGFLELPEAAQAQLVKLWVLASQLGHPLPNKPRFLAGKIGTSGRFHLDRLLAAGFLRPCYQNASTVLAEPEQNARPLSTEDREQSTETTPQSSSRVRLLEIVPDRPTWELEFGMLQQGGRGSAFTPTAEQLESACQDYLGNGAAKTPNLAQFRQYVRRAVAGERTGVAGPNGGRPTNSERALAALKDMT